MASRWKKVKRAFQLSICVYVPPESPSASSDSAFEIDTDVDSFSHSFLRSYHDRLSRIGINSTKQICAICLTSMNRADNNKAVFTAECSHSFHFHCITSNIKHGNRLCPICRSKWSQIPSSPLLLRSKPFLHPPPPSRFHDDQPLHTPSSPSPPPLTTTTPLTLCTFPEFSPLPISLSHFALLLRLKAFSAHESGHHHTPIDLVTIIDVSGSMAGSKLTLLKQAVVFVMQNLSSRDRLSVVVFSSTARRLFPLLRMTPAGRSHAMVSIQSLSASGGTHIAGGLSKGLKLMEERRQRNPVSSIILLSDGKDSHGVAEKNALSLPLPIHTFGIGGDHDAIALHSISQKSGGTFSFIQGESSIQDAFAQCIGGLLSVVAQDVRLHVSSAQPGVRLSSLRSGSVAADGNSGQVEVGDLYAEEEKDFLLSVTIHGPFSGSPLLKVKCVYFDPFSETKGEVTTEVNMERSREGAEEETTPSPEVERERARLEVADAMAEAQAAAERGDVCVAAEILEKCRERIRRRLGGAENDGVWRVLDEELKEMADRVRSKERYAESGRAYILAGMSSHALQRATARGGAEGTTAYQTQSMIEMLALSQVMSRTRSTTSSPNNS